MALPALRSRDVLLSGARTTTQTGPDYNSGGFKGVSVVLDVTAVGTGSVSLEIQGKDLATDRYYPLLIGAAVTTNVVNAYVLFPGAPANIAANDCLPDVWRIVVTANNANSATYSVYCSMLFGPDQVE